MTDKEAITLTIEKTIAGFICEQSPKTEWRKPLVGYAAAEDELFAEVRRRVGPTYELPTTLLKGARAVIAYFVPFTEAVAFPGKPGEGSLSSDAWAYAYIETNILLERIGQAVAGHLKTMGYEGTALPPTHHFDTERLVSDWSHKHAGFIAGLGTWGLHQMLITGAGCCGRFGSVVTSAFFEPSSRPAEELCLYRDRETCGVCVRRCKTGALTFDRFDRHRCYAECLRNESHHADKGWADVCGKCAIFVPCSFQSPAAGKS